MRDLEINICIFMKNNTKQDSVFIGYDLPELEKGGLIVGAESAINEGSNLCVQV